MISLDRAVLESLEHDLGDREVVRQVVRTYLELLPERQRAIAESLETHDLVRLRREAHSLGSSSAIVGAVELRVLCRELESTHVLRADAAFRGLVSAWTSSCAGTEDALNDWLAAS